MENTKKVAANAATAFNATNEYATLYDLRLSEHFTLRNLALSGAVIRHRIANVPTTEETERLRALCENVLEPLRRRFGVIRVVNGYHSEELCDLRAATTHRSTASARRLTYTYRTWRWRRRCTTS